MNADSSPRSTIAAFVLVALAVIGAAVVLLLTRPEPTRITINPPAPTATLAPISVYVTGAVGHPNTTVTLPYGSRAADAVQAAGGTAPDADLERVNLAAIVHDGDQVHVFSLNELNESNALDERQAGATALSTPAAGNVMPLARDPERRQRMKVARGGKPAISEFTVLERFKDGKALVRVRLLTGRTHQIRVHMAFIDCPIVGDTVYGYRKPKIARQFLHAARLCFDHPRTGDRLCFESPLPPYLQAYLDTLSK